MPKQGHFAKSSQIKQLNNFKVKKRGGETVIANNQLTDFLVVRYALTLKKRVKPAYRETIQRMLIEICEQLLTANGNLQQIVPPLLTRLNARVPWQFYLQVLAEWEALQRFLQKELPAVPLRQRLRITASISQPALEELVLQLLVKKVVAITFINQPQADQQRKSQMVAMLTTSLFTNQQIDWKKVRALLQPFPFEIDQSLDEGTRQWLQKLSEQ
ncbi:hypothetical protein H5S09_11130 [Limosilactobacillus sp. STM2_1]|uniref:Uncharacterized protein n=1 Tax=Limosilactobacillus rudii TaxID=2759755 RepID=A0A7W3YNT0_9LACO|nr:hypothetical protein [Limosilactobacillus rudii]MBB1080452.1 hypothetical protein [Limosilactobacillus rudii]MBB1098478.1 hypothetical protein [Limosilactobacillus rudii]MCD7135486.1 hypothetical protein [Limosilactobacillus rudii]